MEIHVKKKKYRWIKEFFNFKMGGNELKYIEKVFEI